MSPAAFEKLWQAIDPRRLRRMLLEMIDIYSPSGKEEDLQLYVEGIFAKAGLTIRRQQVGEEEERFNLLATMGEGEPRLYLVGHVDTVVAWDLDEYGPREENGIIHGLGAADMKGGCAAMIEAWLVLASLPQAEQPPVGLLLVVGEEENGDGSRRFLEESTPPWVVIGEPTSLAVCFSHYGYLEASLLTRGRRSHSSLPELGHNAVESMLRILLHLGRDPIFAADNGQIFYSIREMSSSQAGFVVPDRCETLIDLHLAPEIASDQVKRAIEQRLAAADQLVPELDLSLRFECAADGYRLDGGSWAERLLGTIYPHLGLPLHLSPFRSHSDGNLFFEAGSRPVILGPGSLETAHTEDEQASFAEIEAAVRIYAALCLGVREI